MAQINTNISFKTLILHMAKRSHSSPEAQFILSLRDPKTATPTINALKPKDYLEQTLRHLTKTIIHQSSKKTMSPSYIF